MKPKDLLLTKVLDDEIDANAIETETGIENDTINQLLMGIETRSNSLDMQASQRAVYPPSYYNG